MTDDDIEIHVPVDEVTLMEDRARVVRRGTVELPAGRSRLVLRGVAPVLSDKTLIARSTTARVDDATVTRRQLHRPEDRADAVRELDARIESQRRAVQELRERRRRAEESLSLVTQAARRTVEELEVDAAWCRADVEAWKRRLASVAELEARLRAERLAANRALDDASRVLRALEARRDAEARPSDAIETRITVAVEVEEAGAHALEVEYVVPNACWRPRHRATLEDGRLRFESEGCVWQRTGEDWDDVRLRFSTQRPSLGAEPPRLATDRLRVRRRAERIVVEARQQAVETTGLGRGPAAAPELPGIDDGGEVQELVATHRTRVPSDGRPYRAALFEATVDVEETLTCCPELAAAVIRKTEQVNGSPRPLLAGPVDLVRGGGYVGRTSILYVAPGERFALGWGPDPALRVHRAVEETAEKSKMLSSWITSTRSVVDKLSNLGPEPKRVELVERVPISELEAKLEIAVDVEKTGRDADADGFVRWTLELAAFGREKVELRYVVNRHSDVTGSF
ncbi:MAG: mucoidy inhibitor MuiA family protein [Sandaracinaceae bacterium]